MACDSQLNVAISAEGEKDTKKIHPREYCCESEFPMRSRKSDGRTELFAEYSSFSRYKIVSFRRECKLASL